MMAVNLLALLLPALPAHALAPTTELVSKNASGTQGNDSIDGPVTISDDGRYVSFITHARNLSPEPNKSNTNVYVKDRVTGALTLVNLNSSGGTGYAQDARISGNGRYVVFSSKDHGLGVIGNGAQAFVRDLQTGSLEKISVNANGEEAGLADNGEAYGAVNTAISANGRFVLFASNSTNLLPGVTPSWTGNVVYIKDRQDNTLKVASIDANGNPFYGISGAMSVVTPPDNPTVPKLCFYTSIGGGAYNLYINYGGSIDAVHTHLSNNPVVIHNIDSGCSLTSDGRYLTYSAVGSEVLPGFGTNHMDVFAADLFTNSMLTDFVDVSSGSAKANGYSRGYAVGSHYAIFESDADNLVDGDTNGQRDIFIRDVQARTTSRVSLGDQGQEANSGAGSLYQYAATPTTNRVAFASWSDNLVPGDANGMNDVFVRDFSPTPADTTPPAVTGTPDRTANANGWYNNDVTVSWSAADPAPSSGAPTTPPDTLATTEGSQVTYTSGPSCDALNNCATGSVQLSIDKTAPAISYSLSTPANSAGWNNQAVTVTFACADALSGVDVCTDPVTVGQGTTTVSGSAVDKAGNIASASVVVRVDATKPTIAYAVTSSTPKTAAGWYRTDATVTFACSDADSGLAACTAPVTLGEGANQSVTGTATDVAGNTQTVTATGVNVDKTLPLVTNEAISPNPKLTTATAVLTATVSDGLSGVNSAEYFIGSDPGEGNGATATVSGTTVTVSFNTTFAPGVYAVGVRVKDNAGNWSNAATDYLVVYDGTDSSVTGGKSFTPSVTAGDVLPGLTTGQTTKASFGLSVKYKNGVLNGNNNDFMMDYEVGNNCNKPNNTCQTFNVDSTAIDWLIVSSDAHTATVQGTAYVTVNGVVTSNPFRVEAADNVSQHGHVLVKIYAAGANPNVATPLYQASGDVSQGNVKVGN